jgi:adenylate cyclase
LETTAVKELSRFFSPEIAHQITDSEIEIAVRQGVEREAAVLNVDLRGFTEFASRVEPDELIRRAVRVSKPYGARDPKARGLRG